MRPVRQTKQKPGAVPRPLRLSDLKLELNRAADPERARNLAWFFKTGPGQYGEGDRFLGITVPAQRKIARRYRHLPLDDVSKLLASPIHEHRFTALTILVAKYEAGDDPTRIAVFDFYLANTKLVNNWDLVDTSGPYIVGEHLLKRSRKVLYRLAKSRNLWERRIAMVSTLAFIRRGDIADVFAVAKLLLQDEHDLMHKATGWILREAGKRSLPDLLAFLAEHYAALPRTVLRYAIERLPEEQRQRALRGQFKRRPFHTGYCKPCIVGRPTAPGESISSMLDPGPLPRNRRVLTRREMLAITAVPCLPSLGGAQGVASRGVQAVPRGKPSGIPFLAKFTDVAAEAGLTEPTIYGATDKKDYIIETVGCGVAFVDYDNDGWLDIFVLCGTRLDNPPPGATNRLYKNNRNGTFTDVTKAAGLTKTGWASSVTVGDYNNDGFEDLFITYYGQNVLYRNNGNGTFTDVTAQAGLLRTGRPDWGSGCTFIDYNRDGYLDLFVANYVDIVLSELPKPGENASCNWKGIPVNCGPRGLKTPVNRLYRNNGDGTFTDVSESSGIAKATGTYSMTSVAADFDNDGWTDLYVACDSTPSLFFRNQHDGTFKEEGLERGMALSEDGMEQAGMGLGIGDVDLHGNLDVFKTHFSDDTAVLYRNDGKGVFTDVTLRAGIGVETRYISWGTGIADLDNDGLPDIFVVTGSVYPEVEKLLPLYPLKTPRLVFRNLGNGKFEELIEEAGSGVAAPHCGRGCAFGDFDNDGDIDMVIINLNEPPSLLRNDLSGDRHWLKVLLVGTKSNRSAIGSRVIAHYGDKLQAQAVMAQSSFYSVNDRRLHFGLGTDGTADLEVHWTNGAIEKLAAVKSNQLVVIQEGKGIIKNEPWPRPTTPR